MKKILVKLHIQKLCLIYIMCSTSQLISSAYLENIPITLTQPDGTKIECFTSGDEFYNWVHDANDYTMVKNSKTGYYCYAVLSGDKLVASEYIVGTVSPEVVGLTPKVNISNESMLKKRDAFVEESERTDVATSVKAESSNKTGHINNIVIYICFADQPEFTTSQSTYSSMFNNGHGVSMNNYFKEASYGQLDIETHFYPANDGTTILSYKDSHNRNYYCPYDATTNPDGYDPDSDSSRRSREHTLLANAINSVKSQIPTSLNLDFDNDGKVDNICFIIKGGVTAWGTLLWPHKWTLSSKIVKINDKRIYTYNLQFDDILKYNNVGVLCHEMGHTLGAPDLYHSNSDAQPVGVWDIMDRDQSTPQHMSAYIKTKYFGWIPAIPTIFAPGTYTLNPLTSSSNNCYSLAIENSSEYIVLEYRKKMGLFETSIPNNGLIIYRINENYEGNFNGIGYGGISDEIYVYRPDGTVNSDGVLSHACFSDAYNRISFNNLTNPNCFTSTNKLGNVCICNIKELPNGKLSFDVRFCDGDNIVYTGTSVIPPLTKACNNITTSGNVTIKQNESIIFFAGEGITLNPGFDMENNSSLEMYVQ